MRTMKGHGGRKSLARRLGHAEALYHDMSASAARILKKRGIAHGFNFGGLEEASGKNVVLGRTSVETPPGSRGYINGLRSHHVKKRDQARSTRVKIEDYRQPHPFIKSPRTISAQESCKKRPRLKEHNIDRREASGDRIESSQGEQGGVITLERVVESQITSFQNQERSSRSARSNRQSFITVISIPHNISNETRSSGFPRTGSHSFCNLSSSLSLLSLDVLEQSTQFSTQFGWSSLLSYDSVAVATDNSLPTSIANTPSSVIADRCDDQ